MKKCVLIINAHKKESHAIGEKIVEFLKNRGIQSDFFIFDGFSHVVSFGNVDFVVTLGGDGTVLFAARCCAALGIPVFPVNLGEFGFIASIEKHKWEEPLDKFLADKMYFSERSLLEISIAKTESTEEINDFSGMALNDIVISAEKAVSTVLLDVFYNNVALGVFKADGIIVSTATGSTAYSASAGGPIIDPELDAFVLTPVNAFSLSVRPLVLNPKGVLEVEVLPSRTKNAVVTIDGQEPVRVNCGDRILIKKAAHSIKLIGCSSKNFCDALCSKLNWSGGPHVRKTDN